MTENTQVFTDKLPPHDDKAEECVVGSLLLDRDGVALETASSTLKATDIYGARTHLIFDACLTLKDMGQAVDQVTLTHHLKSRGRLDTVGAGYISHLIAMVPTPTVAGEITSMESKQDPSTGAFDNLDLFNEKARKPLENKASSSPAP